ncbi:MAG TPA: DUF1360 domain-containing protein [Jatrophihabitans sp.]|jgi:hypothetical protein|nr:DUF1360 domain-containing protein [Jatrophihabitans sp.]
MTASSASDRPLARVRGWLRQQGVEYRNGADRPLAGYLVLLSVYSSGTLGAVGAARLLGRRAPQRISPWDLAQLTVATHKVSRLIAKDPVTSPLRSPFTRYEGVSAPSELHEEVRGHGVRHSAGELLTCPMCLAQWVATAFMAGLVLAPVPTRLALATFSAVAGSDFLQHLYVRLQQATE